MLVLFRHQFLFFYAWFYFGKNVYTDFILDSVYFDGHFYAEFVSAPIFISVYIFVPILFRQACFILAEMLMSISFWYPFYFGEHFYAGFILAPILFRSTYLCRFHFGIDFTVVKIFYADFILASILFRWTCLRRFHFGTDYISMNMVTPIC